MPVVDRVVLRVAHPVRAGAGRFEIAAHAFGPMARRTEEVIGLRAVTRQIVVPLLLPILVARERLGEGLKVPVRALEELAHAAGGNHVLVELRGARIARDGRGRAAALVLCVRSTDLARSARVAAEVPGA